VFPIALASPAGPVGRPCVARAAEPEPTATAVECGGTEGHACPSVPTAEASVPTAEASVPAPREIEGDRSPPIRAAPTRLRRAFACAPRGLGIEGRKRPPTPAASTRVPRALAFTARMFGIEGRGRPRVSAVSSGVPSALERLQVVRGIAGHARPPILNASPPTAEVEMSRTGARGPRPPIAYRFSPAHASTASAKSCEAARCARRALLHAGPRAASRRSSCWTRRSYRVSSKRGSHARRRRRRSISSVSRYPLAATMPCGYRGAWYARRRAGSGGGNLLVVRDLRGERE